MPRLCVQRINGIPNAVTASGPTPDRAPQYQIANQVAGWLRELQLRDQISIGFTARDDSGEAVLLFHDAALGSSEYQQIVGALGLSPGRRDYRIVPGVRPQDGDTITLQTRPLNGMLHYLTQAVLVPAAHVRAALLSGWQFSAGPAARSCSPAGPAAWPAT